MANQPKPKVGRRLPPPEISDAADRNLKIYERGMIWGHREGSKFLARFPWEYIAMRDHPTDGRTVEHAKTKSGLRLLLLEKYGERDNEFYIFGPYDFKRRA